MCLIKHIHACTRIVSRIWQWSLRYCWPSEEGLVDSESSWKNLTLPSLRWFYDLLIPTLEAIEYDWHRQFLISFPASKTEYFETRISVPLHTVAGASPFPLYTRAMGQLRGRNCAFAWLATAPRTSPVRGIVDALHNSAAVPQALGVRKEKNKHVAACTSLGDH